MLRADRKKCDAQLLHRQFRSLWKHALYIDLRIRVCTARNMYMYILFLFSVRSFQQNEVTSITQIIDGGEGHLATLRLEARILHFTCWASDDVTFLEDVDVGGSNLFLFC